MSDIKRIHYLNIRRNPHVTCGGTTIPEHVLAGVRPFIQRCYGYDPSPLPDGLTIEDLHALMAQGSLTGADIEPSAYEEATETLINIGALWSYQYGENARYIIDTNSATKWEIDGLEHCPNGTHTGIQLRRTSTDHATPCIVKVNRSVAEFACVHLSAEPHDNPTVLQLGPEVSNLDGLSVSGFNVISLTNTRLNLSELFLDPDGSVAYPKTIGFIEVVVDSSKCDQVDLYRLLNEVDEWRFAFRDSCVNVRIVDLNESTSKTKRRVWINVMSCDLEHLIAGEVRLTVVSKDKEVAWGLCSSDSPAAIRLLTSSSEYAKLKLSLSDNIDQLTVESSLRRYNRGI